MNFQSLLLVSTLLPCTIGAFGQAGTLDASFGTAGLAEASFSTGPSNGYSMAVLPDGSILTGGYCNNAGNFDFAFARFTENGELDASFGTDGLVLAPVGSGVDLGYSLAVASNGKFYLGGFVYSTQGCDPGIVRFNSDGTLDDTFGDNGKVITILSNGCDALNGIAVQADGKILAVGSKQNATDPDLIVLRYTEDGDPDATFGTGGQVVLTYGGQADYALKVALQPDGKILVVGHTIISNLSVMTVSRLNTDGTLDNSFSSDGWLATDFAVNDALGQWITVQPDGKILAGGYTLGADLDFAIACFLPNGELDTDFGIGGYAITAFGPNDDDFSAGVALQPDGKFVVCGATRATGDDYDMALVRYLANGTLDAGFGTGGRVITAPNPDSGDDWQSVALQSTGKLVACGTSGTGLTVGRYLTDLQTGLAEEREGGGALTVFPNPIQDHATVQLELKNPGSISAALFAADGRWCASVLGPTYVPAGPTNLRLELPEGLAHGAYDLRLSTPDGLRGAVLVK
jgi:uncharacterized delta-60 repeat protein